MSVLIAFLIIWTISPGPVAALALNHARQYGYRTGIAVAAGATISSALILGAAIIVHTFGISVVETGDASIAQIIGGTLIVLMGMNAGYKAYVSIGETTSVSAETNQNKRSFIQGMMILTASIPQSIIFYAILIPQTVANDNILPIIIGMGLAKVVLTFIWNTGVAIAADRAQAWLSNPLLSQRFDFATAIIMVAFGVNILL